MTGADVLAKMLVIYMVSKWGNKDAAAPHVEALITDLEDDQEPPSFMEAAQAIRRQFQDHKPA